MPRQKEANLSANLIETEFRFIPKGVYTLKEIYIRVKKKYPNLCDDNYLCIQNCKSGKNSPEWNHTIRNCMKKFKVKGSMVNISRGIWELK